MITIAQNLLQAALALLLMLQQNPGVDVATKNMAITTANTAISYATQVLKSGGNPVQQGLVITSPLSGESVILPITVKGYVNGAGWTPSGGEAGYVQVLDANGKQISARTPLRVVTDAMNPPTYFEALVGDREMMSHLATKTGTLVFMSTALVLGEPALRYDLPIVFGKVGETMPVKLYFYNTRLGDDYSCQQTMEVTRLVPKTTMVATAALNALLQGPTTAEAAQGFSQRFPAGSKLNSLRIENGVAYADFNQATSNGGGSCYQGQLTAAIRKTLMQFPTVQRVILSVEGQTDPALIFQP